MKRKVYKARKKSSKNKFARGKKGANLFELKEEEKNPFKNPINGNNKNKTSKGRKHIFEKPKNNSHHLLLLFFFLVSFSSYIIVFILLLLVHFIII